MSAAAALCTLFYVLPPQANYSRPPPHAQQKTRPLYYNYRDINTPYFK